MTDKEYEQAAIERGEASTLIEHWKQRALAAEAERDGANQRAKMLFEAKNYWLDRCATTEAERDVNKARAACFPVMLEALRHVNGEFDSPRTYERFSLERIAEVRYAIEQAEAAANKEARSER